MYGGMEWDWEEREVRKRCCGTGGRQKAKKECLEGESNSHLRITQAMLGHMMTDMRPSY
jgi:hypothetical protein